MTHVTDDFCRCADCPPPGLRPHVRVAPAEEAALGPCWLWIRRVDETGRGAGYGRIGRAGRAHVLSYLFLGAQAVPEGYELDHLCKRRACVRPSHLEPVSHAENMRRLRPEKCPQGHELTEANLSRSGKGRGVCRACRNAKRRARAAAKRAALVGAVA